MKEMEPAVVQRDPENSDPMLSSLSTPPRKMRTGQQTPSRPLARPADKRIAVPPPPDRSFWQQVHLPLQFRSQENRNRDRYVIFATVPGIDIDDVKLQLGGDASELTIEGLRLPTDRDNSALQHKVAEFLRGHASTFDVVPAGFGKQLQQIGLKAYLDLGEGLFGRFSQTFAIPDDVNVEAISASYENGMLQVDLPKIMPDRTDMTRRWFDPALSSHNHRTTFRSSPSLNDLPKGGNLPDFWWW